MHKTLSFFRSHRNSALCPASRRVDRMKHTLTISLLITICGALLSCGPTSIFLINLKTNDLRYCTGCEVQSEKKIPAHVKR